MARISFSERAITDIMSFPSHRINGSASLTTIQRRGGRKLGGVTIVPPKTIRDYPDARVFLAVRKIGKHCQDDIARQLGELGVGPDRIIRVDRVIDRLEHQQYFSVPALYHSPQEVFVDVGAFDGDTVRRFVEWAGSFEHIYAFEPDPSNGAKCRATLSEIAGERGTLLPYGVWSEKGELRFNVRGDMQSHIEETGEECLLVTSIDQELAGKRVTFIKMDIEGAEMPALHGAEQTIRENRPKMAVCIYHRPDDILDIPDFLLSIHPDYRFYLRHHSLRNEETVLYAL